MAIRNTGSGRSLLTINTGRPLFTKGRDGDLGLYLESTGISLYGKFDKKWYKFGQGIEVDSKGRILKNNRSKVDIFSGNVDTGTITVGRDRNRGIYTTYQTQNLLLQPSDENVSLLLTTGAGGNAQFTIPDSGAFQILQSTTNSQPSLFRNSTGDSGIHLSTLTDDKDPYITFVYNVAGDGNNKNWTIGMDESDTQKFKIMYRSHTSTILPSSGSSYEMLTITTGGNVTAKGTVNFGQSIISAMVFG